MIFNVTNGATAVAGSWRFTTAAAKPDAVDKRTMLAVVATAPATVTVADEAPANPAANDVWFHVVNPAYGCGMSDGTVAIQCLGAYALHADEEASAAETTVSGGTVTVDLAAIKAKANGKTCKQTFCYDGTNWKLDGETVALSEYGVAITAGVPANGDTITASFTAGWTLVTAYYSYLGTWWELPGLPASGTTLADCSWAQIHRVAAAGKAADYFCIGDEKPITLTTGETVTLQILDFAHDDLAAAGGGKAPITLGFKDCLNTVQKLNAASTNVGGYSGCAFYGTLNSTILNALPADLIAVMKQVNKGTSAGNQLATIVTTQEKLFLLSEVEVSGNTSANSKAGEGTQYAFFTNGGARVKKVGETAAIWWLRSPSAYNAQVFCRVNADGTTSYTAALNEYGVAAALCV